MKTSELNRGFVSNKQLILILAGTVGAIFAYSLFFEGSSERKAHKKATTQKAAKLRHTTGTAPHWLAVDIGDKVNVTWLKARLRPGHPQHFWRKARLEGSNDGTTFTKIADVSQRTFPSSDDEWLIWEIPATDNYKHYRLSIFSGYSDGRFYSFSELELGNPEQGQVLTEDCKFTSSPHLELHPPKYLIDGDPETFWHVK